MAVLSRLSSTTNVAFRRHFQLAITRTVHIAAAAVPQPQFDYDYDYSGSSPSSPAMAEVDSDGSRTLRDVHWIFIGNPNSKKHVYAHLISKLLRVPHISITTLLRQDLNPHSPLYQQIADAINHGKLVPESIIFGLLSKRLKDGHDRGENGFILDGIPRTRLQAEILDQLVDVDLVVNFKCPEDDFQAASSSDSVASRNSTKSSFSNLNKTTEEAKPKVSTFYREQMQLLEDYYQNQKKLIDFQVGNAPGETWKGLLAALRLQHINAVRSSQSLTTRVKVPLEIEFLILSLLMLYCKYDMRKNHTKLRSCTKTHCFFLF